MIARAALCYLLVGAIRFVTFFQVLLLKLKFSYRTLRS